MTIDINDLRFSAANSIKDLALLPSEVLELLDRLEAAEKDSAHHKALAESALRVAKGWEDKCDELRAKIAEMEQQESVATVIKEGDSRYWMSERLWTFPDGKYPLYALPGAKGEAK